MSSIYSGKVSDILDPNSLCIPFLNTVLGLRQGSILENCL